MAGIYYNALLTFNTRVADYTLAASDQLKDTVVEMNVGIANTVTIPLSQSVAFPIGSQIVIAQYGAGQTTIVGASGVTVRTEGGKNKITAQYGIATLIKRGTDEWYLAGNLSV